jgi:hypothetical protein
MPDQALHAFGFGKNRGYAGSPRLSFRSAAMITSQHYQRNLREQSLQLARGFQPIHHRHPQVQDNKIWRELFGFADSVDAILGFATHGKSGLALKCEAKRSTDRRMVVHYEYGCQESC